jgi:hypothetical protein
VKPLEELMRIRNEALEGIRRLQLRIVAIDVTVSTCEPYVDQLNSWGGDIREASPTSESLRRTHWRS